MERLQKFMALCGVASRRKCEELILQGKVRINGEIVTQLGSKVDENRDTVEVEGKAISLVSEHIYIMVNKPVGFVTTVKDQFGRPTVLDLIKEKVKDRVYPVGRLDYDSCGLIILTNDGELTFRVTHPRHSVTKRYLCLLDKIPSAKDIREFSSGVNIGDYVTAPADARLVSTRGEKGFVQVEISEGKNRQIRRMWSALGLNVLFLQRISIGEIELGELKEGQWRYLSKDEVLYLKSKV